MKLIDRFLPSFDYRIVHSTSMRCSRREAFNAIKELTPAELSPAVWFLFWLRGVPARLAGYPYPHIQRHQPIVRQLAESGFLVSDEEGESEIVLGMIGQYWKPHGEIRRVESAEDFLAFDKLDNTMAAMNFVVNENPDSGSVLVTTETRIYTPGPTARRRFSLYWTLVRLGSGHIRREILRALKRRAERHGPSQDGN